MLRKLPLSLSLLSCVVLGSAACEKGGTFDPLDNVPQSGSPASPTPTADLPLCDAANPKLPCRIELSNLSFTESCSGVMNNGMTWNNPEGRTDRLQFGTNEGTLINTATCNTPQTKDCTASLTNLPAALNALPETARVRLTFNQRYLLSDDILLNSDSPPKVESSRLMLAVPQAGGRDLATYTGSRKNGTSPELHTTSVWFSPSPMRTLSFTVRSRCYRAFDANAFWYIEKMTAEALPALP
jgi:hypothetical protein